MRFRFADFELDQGNGALWRGEESVPMQPRVRQILQYLVANAGRIVSAEELNSALRDGGVHDSGSIPWNIYQVRKVLGQPPRARAPIETIRGQGYRFSAPVRRLESLAERDATPIKGPVFVGRQAFLAELWKALREAQAGRGGLSLITGPAGIGKTRLAAELGNQARSEGITVLTGRCLGDPIAPAFWPFIQILRAYREARLGSEELRQSAAELLLRVCPSQELAPTPQLAGRVDDAGFWLLDHLRSWFLRAAQQNTHVLIIDDLQWVDERSRQLIALLSDWVEASRLLLVATLRKAPHELASAVESKVTPSLRIPLVPFSEAEVHCYLESALGSNAASALSRSVQQFSGGNPLFVSEASALIAARREPPGAEVPLDFSELPKKILAARASQLGSRGIQTLQAASALGTEFTLPDVARIDQLPEAELVQWLDQALEQRLIVRQESPETFAFAHDLLRDTVYEALTTGQRAQLHARAASALQARLPGPGRLSELAHHFYHALPYVDRAEVTEHCRAAGDAAMHVCAYEEAARHYDRAIEVQEGSPKADAEVQCGLLLRSSAALIKVGRPQESRQRCGHAIELAKHAGLASPLVMAAGLLRPSPLLARQPDSLLEDALHSAEKMLPEGPSAERVLLYSGLAGVPPHSLSVEGSRKLAEEALNIARELDSKQLLVEALRAHLYALSGPDNIDSLLEVTEQIERNEPPGASWSKAQAYLSRYHALTLRGELEAAEEALIAFGTSAKEMRLVSAVWEFERIRAQHLLQKGDAAAAEARFEALYQEGVQLGIGWAKAAHWVHRETVQMHRTGRLTGADGATKATLPWENNFSASRAFCIPWFLYQGRQERARRELKLVLESSIPRDVYYVAALVQLAQGAVYLGDLAVARQVRALLLPYRRLNPLTPLQFCLGSAAHYLGLLSHLCGELEQAEQDFEEAARTNFRLGYIPLALCSQLALAATLLSQRSESQRVRALDLGQEVSQAARRLGMVVLATRAARLESAPAKLDLALPICSDTADTPAL